MSEADKRVIRLYRQTVEEIKVLEQKVTGLREKTETVVDFLTCMAETSPGILRPGSTPPYITNLRIEQAKLLRETRPLEADLAENRQLLEELDICQTCEGSGYHPPKTHVREGPGPGPLCSTCSGTGTKTGAAKINAMSPEEKGSFRKQKIESDRKKMTEGWFKNY